MKSKNLKSFFCILLSFLIIGVCFLSGCNDTDPEEIGNFIDVYLIGGQSNAAGTSPINTALEADLTKIFSNIMYAGETERNFTKNTVNSSFIDEFAPNVTAGLGRSSAHIGPEYGMAELLDSRYSQSKPALIYKYAAGGTALQNKYSNSNDTNYGNWYPRSLWETLPQNEKYAGTGKCYEFFIENFKTVYQKLTDDGYIVRIKGMAWMQGESDRETPASRTLYAELIKILVADLRAELSEITNRDLSNMPFVAGEISNTQGSARAEDLEKNLGFNQMLNNLEEQGAISNFKVAKAGDLPIHNSDGTLPHPNAVDPWHWIADYEVILGNRFAEKLLEMNT